MNKVIVILLIGAILYFVFMNDKKENVISKGLNLFTDSDGHKAVLAVKEKHGEQIARIVERMLRLETGHFKSQQFQKTGTAGMEAGKWKDLPKLPTIEMNDKKKPGIEKFIVWNPKDFALYLAAYIIRYGGKFERWNSLDPIAQQKYRAAVMSVKTKFV